MWINKRQFKRIENKVDLPAELSPAYILSLRSKNSDYIGL